ncbi:MAG: iron ABC transporter permease [Candidatus Helarchaeota archaeon]|nr:iron ABC transporter permease [Candidatus Helarchaeota archaeon]
MGQLIRKIEKGLSTRFARIFGDTFTLVFFILIIIVPILYIFTFVGTEWNSVFTNLFNHPITGDGQWFDLTAALLRSFQIAAIVTLIDVIIGLPMALILARYNFRGKKYIDTLIDLPLAVPTAALGFSIYLFWGTQYGIGGLFGLEAGLFSEGPLMIILVHIVFTYPYIVRNLKEVIMRVDRTYEHAAQSLGASKFTVFRTITGPLMKEGLVAGAILAFTRSLGETGATMIVFGVTETSPIQIVAWRSLGLFGPAAFLTMILVLVALGFLILLKLITRRVGLPIHRVFVRAERKLSHPIVRKSRNAIIALFFLIVVILPSLWTFVFIGFNGEAAYSQMFLSSDNKLAAFWLSLMSSLSIAGMVTLICIVLGIPMALIMVRRKWGKIKSLLDTLIDIPLVVPSAALGFSVFVFWGTLGPFGPDGLFSPGYWLIVLVHVVFCYPYMVRVLIPIISSLDPGYEEAARTLGAPSFTVFRTCTWPLLKRGVLAGSIITFTRSLGETGATLVVMGLARTVPVLIVDWVEAQSLAAASFASIIIIIFSFMLIFILRKITLEKEVVK